MTASSLNPELLRAFAESQWHESVLPELIDYIRIPNQSPAFDPDWQKHGFMDQVVEQFANWCRRQDIEGMALEVVKLPGRTPLLFLDIEGASEETVLLYGHLDKQPEMTGWREDLGPWKPVLEGDKLYGRGGADDGYALFASLLAIRALKLQQVPHARCVIIIEACEESGSVDLPFYLEKLQDRIGTPSLVICLDSGCGNYDQLWNTTSLRGHILGNLRVEILTEGVHSGNASGIVPSSFRIARQLLDRIDDIDSGQVLDAAFQVEIPAQRNEQAQRAAAVLGDEVYQMFPFVENAQPVQRNLAELVLNRTWRAALSITGADGVPSMAEAGNVLRPYTELKLAMRLPPTSDAEKASQRLKQLLETDPPYAAKVTYTPDQEAGGWHAPEIKPWLQQVLDQASQSYFGKPAMHMGEGGSIPFMGMLGEQFPEAQFLITGVLGPNSNAHGPNEFLHIPTAKKLTCCVAEVLAQHFAHSR